MPASEVLKLILSPGLMKTVLPPVEIGQLLSSTPVTAKVAVSVPAR